MKTPVSHDQRGIAHIGLIGIIMVVIAVVGFAAWRMTNKNEAADTEQTKRNQNSSQTLAACQQEIDDDDFCKFASNYADLGAYSATMKTGGANGSAVITLETDGKDNTRMKTESDGATVAEYISIGNTTYVKDLSDGAWVKYASDDYQVEDITDDVSVDFDQSDVPEAERIQYKRLGKEACGDLSCFKYQIIDPGASQEEPTETFIWFDDKDYRLRRMQFTGGEGSTDVTITYSSVTISEPSPVKEADTPVDGPSEAELKELLESYQNTNQ